MIHFKDKSLIVAFTVILFLTYAIWQIRIGFGEDTDAWLMAQSAEKIRMGLGYDPGRSLGNPFYELQLSVLQTGDQWWISNLVNLLIFLVLLKRVRNYFPFLSTNGVAGVRFLFLMFPLFLKNASSSIEFTQGLWFLLEAFHSIENKQSQKATIWTILAMFTRLEYFPILILSQMPFWQKNKGKALVLTAFWIGYLVWAWGKNPVPFLTISEGLNFYASRLGILIESMGLSILFLPVFLFNLIKNEKIKNWKNLSMTNLGLFILTPFEWEYALPFFTVSLIAIGDKHGFSKTVAIGVLFFTLSFFKPEIRHWVDGQFTIRTEWPHEQRENSYAQYIWAQNADFEQKTIFLYGATLFPFPVRNWEKAKDNRIFHRKNSNFYVGERLTNLELDSLRLSGFRVKN